MKIVTSLSFRGQCREAFEFYAKVLGGKITPPMPYGDGPPDMPMTAVVPGLADALLAGGRRPGIDGGGHGRRWAPNIDKPKNGFDVTLHTDDAAEARRWYDALMEGGKPVMPFGETFWSPGFGGLIDRFGVPWMVNTVPSADSKPANAG